LRNLSSAAPAAARDVIWSPHDDESAFKDAATNSMRGAIRPAISRATGVRQFIAATQFIPDTRSGCLVAAGQILNLMRDLQDKFGLTYLFISHNLRCAAHATRIGVMYLGRIVRSAEDANCSISRMPYTKMLWRGSGSAMSGRQRIPVKAKFNR